MYTKKQQVSKRRIKPTQRQKGNISSTTREQVFSRSNGICERCRSQRATQMAHIIGRKQIDHVTTERDLLHVCVQCHVWMDTTPEGIKWKRGLTDESLVLGDDDVARDISE